MNTTQSVPWVGQLRDFGRWLQVMPTTFCSGRTAKRDDAFQVVVVVVVILGMLFLEREKDFFFGLIHSFAVTSGRVRCDVALGGFNILCFFFIFRGYFVQYFVYIYTYLYMLIIIIIITREQIRIASRPSCPVQLAPRGAQLVYTAVENGHNTHWHNTHSSSRHSRYAITIHPAAGLSKKGQRTAPAVRLVG